MKIPNVRLIALAGLVFAQNPFRAGAQSAPGFEVASIKPHRTGGDSSDRKLLPGGRFVGTNVSVRTMIRIALGLADQAGGPRWIDDESYDVDAKAGSAANITPEQLSRLMLALLEERFQFKFHRETKEGQVYHLDLAKNG